MANLPARNPAADRCRLVPFDPVWAEVVVSWVRDAQEAYWLAPKSTPPLTSRELLRWRKPDHNPYLLMDGGRCEPVGYGELNRMTVPRRQYWLGHLLVNPAFRGRGYGVQLTALLLTEAFEQRGAQRVTLVAFPENAPALACYRAAGMVDDGWEWHTFPAYGRRACLVRLAASRLA
jgi:RimJ/RimL family protein N-acetyltransferase